MSASPLRGRRIVVTRPEGQAENLIALLRAAGAEVLHLPMISVEEHRHAADDALIAALPGEFDWLAFTSRNAVRIFALRLPELRPTLPRIAVVGAATAVEVERCGWRVDLIGSRADGDALAQALGDVGARSVLYPCAAEAGDFAERLRRRGASVRSLVVYRTKLRDRSIGALPACDAVLFASASAVRAWARCAPESARAVHAVCIGETTAAAARAAGLSVLDVASEVGDGGLVECLRSKFGTL